MNFRRQALLGLQAAMYWSGLAAAYSRNRQARGLIAMYHSVADRDHAPWISPHNRMDPRTFERQIRFLKRHRKIVSMDHLLRMIDDDVPLPRGTVAITFDDGYVDTLRVAAPILGRLGVPATIYLPSGYLDRGENHWSDTLHALIERRRRQHVEINGRAFDLNAPADRAAAEANASKQLLESLLEPRCDLLDQVRRQLAVKRDEPRLTLSWDEVTELVERYPIFSLGSHTVDHIDLSTHPERAESEMSQARAQIEARVGRAVEHFSFPYGRSTDAARQTARSLGYRSAVVSEERFAFDSSAQPFRLPRFEASASSTRFRLQTSGAHPDLSLALLGRS